MEQEIRLVAECLQRGSDALTPPGHATEGIERGSWRAAPPVLSACRGRARFGKPGRDDLVARKRPHAGHDSTDEYEVGVTADQLSPGGRDDVGISRARTKDPLVIARQESHSRRPGRRGHVFEVFAASSRWMELTIYL
jgi:hypothetical protein